MKEIECWYPKVVIYFCESKLKNDFGAATRYLYTHVFWSLSRDISLLGDSFPFWSLSRDMSIWRTFFFFGRFVQKLKVSCFSASFVQKTTQQSDGSCNVTSDSQLSYKLFKKQALYFCKNIWKINFDWRLLYCSPRWQDVLFTQLQISQKYNRQH